MAVERWEGWLEAQVIPALRRCPVFSKWPMNLLKAIVAPLAEEVFKPGEIITEIGEPADSMLVLLDGRAKVETKTGLHIGTLTAGATFGAAAALGLFETRPSTLRAAVNCRVLIITGGAIRKLLESPEAKEASREMDMLIQSRRQQVEKGLPITALPLHVTAEDLCAKAIALNAERFQLAPGSAWEPHPDSGPCGPHVAVLAKGRGMLEIVSDKRTVMSVGPGSLLVEGLLAEHGAQFRASKACEIYSMRRCDIAAAVDAMTSAQGWFLRFRLLEKEVRQDSTLRLQSAHGASVCLVPHQFSDDLKQWKLWREECVTRAAIAHKEWQETGSRPSSASTTASSQIHGVRARSASSSRSQPAQKQINGGEEELSRKPAQVRPQSHQSHFGPKQRSGSLPVLRTLTMYPAARIARERALSRHLGAGHLE